MPNYGDHYAFAYDRRKGDPPDCAYSIAVFCESPIELIMGAALNASCPPVFKVVPQYKCNGYRIDFAIVYNEKPIAFVECDGSAFHITREQVARDRRKDGDARSAGIRMFRFSGKRIVEDADMLASRVWFGIM